jgi:hypothetical protein
MRIAVSMFLSFFYCYSLNAQVADSSLRIVQDTLTNPFDKAPDSTQITGSQNKAGLTSAAKKKSYSMAGLSFMDDNVYLGRKDSMRLPYIIFDLGYYFKSGFFIDGSINYLAGSQVRIDAVNFTGGYSFTVKKYSGEASLSKYFYSNQSTNIKSAVTSSLSYFNSYDFGFITPTLTVFLDFGTKTDVGGIIGLEHTFFGMNDKLDFTPTFTMNLSTLNFYSNYYKTRRYNIKRKNKAPTTGIASISGIVQNASALKVLDYEISFPADYKVGNFTFNINPVYSIPVNPSVVEVTTTKANNTSTKKVITEKIDNSFFVTAGVTYKFGK